MARNSKEVVEGRRKQVLHMVLTNGETSIEKLAQQLDVSTMTIRRDVDELISQQMLQKASVGAVKLTESFEVDPGYAKRHILRRTEKTMIAIEAAQLLQDGMIVGLDASTTTLELAKQLLPFRNISVVTNGLLIPRVLATHPSLKLELAGGSVRGAALSTVGTRTCNELARYHYDIVFISSNAVDVRYGLTDTSDEEIETKLAMLKNATTKVLLVDSSKIGKRAFCKCCDISNVDIVITDDGARQEDIDAFLAHDIKVIIAKC